MFITELWQSIFTPGTTPALLKATHASFILLILSLIWLIYLSGSIHFINLLVIAVLLYATVIWFVNELEQVKLKSNDDIEQEEDQAEQTEKTEKSEETEPKNQTKQSEQTEQAEQTQSSTTGSKGSSSAPRKRKV